MTHYHDSDYWEISLEEAFEEAEITFPSDEKFKILVKTIKGCAEVQHEMTGQDCIPNPLTTEISRLKKLLTQTREEAENKEYIYKNVIAARYGYREDYSVHIEGDRVVVEERPK